MTLKKSEKDNHISNFIFCMIILYVFLYVFLINYKNLIGQNFIKSEGKTENYIKNYIKNYIFSENEKNKKAVNDWLNKWEKITITQKYQAAYIAVQLRKLKENRYFYIIDASQRQIIDNNIIKINNSKKNDFSEFSSLVAENDLMFVEFEKKIITNEEFFVKIQKMYTKMQQFGFQKLKNQDIGYILTDFARYMYEHFYLDKALEYGLQAEKMIDISQEKWILEYVLLLNLIQNIYQKQEYPNEAQQYAQKILDYCQKIKNNTQTNPIETQRLNVWRGLASLDMSQILVTKKNITESEKTESEKYAQKGLDFFKIQKPDNAEIEAEYDALKILLNIKILLKKENELSPLLQRCNNIRDTLGKIFKQNHLKHLTFYKASAIFFELNNDFKNALQYANLHKQWQDTLTKNTQNKKLQDAQKKLDMENYLKKIDNLESSKKIQNVILQVLLFVFLGFLGGVFWYYYQNNIKKRNVNQKLVNYKKINEEKTKLLDNLQIKMQEITKKKDNILKIKELQQKTILTNEDWTSFKMTFEEVYPDFIQIQKTDFPDITPAELRILMLQKLQLNVNEMANMLGISANSVYKTQQRLKKKM